MVDPVLDLEPDLAASWDAELGLLGLLGTGGSAGLVAGVADAGLPVPLGLAIGLLAAVDPYALDGDARVDLVRAWERVAAAVAGAASSGRWRRWWRRPRGPGRPAEEARHEVGAALRLSGHGGVAGGRWPGSWCTGCRRCRPRWRRAVIGYLQAARDRGRGPGPARRAGGRGRGPGAADRAGARPWRETKRAVARAVQTVDPAAAADRHQQAHRGRTIEQMPQPDGMESTWLTVPAPVSKDLWASLTAGAKAAQADRRAGRAAVPRAERAAGRRPGARRARQRRRRPAPPAP